MLNVKYDYSSVQIDVPSALANEIIEWGKLKVTDDDIFVTQKDPTFGREDEIHSTILYGLHTNSSEEVRNLVKDFGPINVKLGKVGIFTDPMKYDVVMINVISEEMCKLNELIKKNFKYTTRYQIFKPHITIAYVKKGKGWKHSGLKNWQGVEFSCNHILFSSKNGIKDKIFV